MTPTTGGASPRRVTRRGPPWLVIVTTLVMVLVVGGGAFAFTLLGPYVHQRVTDEAKQRGVEIAFADVRFFWWSASLEAVRFRLVGVPGLEGTAESIDVALADWEPRQIEGTNVKLAVVGSVADLALAVTEWTRAHPQAFRVPLSAHGVGVALRAALGEAPWLTLDGGAMSHNPSGTTFSANHAVVSGVDVGAVGASWTTESASVSMSFGSSDPKTSPLQIIVRHAATPPTATVTLAPVELSRLTGPLGIPLPAPGVTVSGHADLTFVSGFEAGPVTGQVDSRLDGWIPPHPVELDGFLFGTTTTFTSNLSVDATRTVVQLSGSRVKAGAFDLTGGGRIDRAPASATILMNLAGNLPCSAVAQSAAAAHVGSFLAEIVGNATRRVVEGSVGVRVKIAADSRNLAGATVEPTVGVGCGLKPLKAIDPKLLQRIPGVLQTLANQLPSLPDLQFP
jgi:hypothetical protein